jgi:hypothetical protein
MSRGNTAIAVEPASIADGGGPRHARAPTLQLRIRHGPGHALHHRQAPTVTSDARRPTMAVDRTATQTPERPTKP